MSSDFKDLINVSAWVSPHDVFKPVFLEEYGKETYVVRVFDRKPIDDIAFDTREAAERFAHQDGRLLMEEDIRPLSRVDGKDIPTGQLFEYWYKTDAAIPYYVIVNMTPGEKISVMSLMADDKPLFMFDSYEQTRIALWQDVYSRVDELDPD